MPPCPYARCAEASVTVTTASAVAAVAVSATPPRRACPLLAAQHGQARIQDAEARQVALGRNERSRPCSAAGARDKTEEIAAPPGETHAVHCVSRAARMSRVPDRAAGVGAQERLGSSMCRRTPERLQHSSHASASPPR